MRKRKIVRISPNAVHLFNGVKDGKYEIEATFFCRPDYALKLARVMFWMSVEDYRQGVHMRPLYWRLGAATAAFFFGLKVPILFFAVTDTFNSNSGGDGHTQYTAGGADWATPHDAASQGATSNQSTSIFLRTENCGACSPSGYYLQRHHWPFDTSSIPNDATKSSATWSAYYDATGNDNTDGGSISLVQSTQASGTALANADYSALNTTKVATDVTFASVITAGAGYIDMALNGTGLTDVSLTGYTFFASRTAKDVSNTAPGARQYLQNITYADSGSNKPKLAVTYTVPSAATAGSLLMASLAIN